MAPLSIDQDSAIKRRAVGSQNVIVADDIAAFPDLNLAESLQRIPGVTISRDADVLRVAQLAPERSRRILHAP